jgi:dTMP kinase
MRVDSDTYILPHKPAFITFEGINGCGKTTLHRSLSLALQNAQQKVIDTREPGGTPLGKEIRKLVLEWPHEKISSRAELLLFAADRAEHVDKVIRPSLARGEWVLSDRYLFSSITFQGHGRGIDRSWIDQANELATQGTMPHLVILLDLPIEEAMRRISSRTDNGKDSFESEALDFQQRIRDGFLECAESASVAFLVLDATKSPETLVAEALRVLMR